MKTKYSVPIIYRGQSNFIVEAETEKEARIKASTMFDNDAAPVTLGNEWEIIERVGDIEVVA